MRTKEEILKELEPNTGMGMTIYPVSIAEKIIIELLFDIRECLVIENAK